MAVSAVVFDLGETLIDESGAWQRAADAAGGSRSALLGGLRRGPWGHVHDPPPDAVAMRSLDELPEAIGG
jgi:hypothetical protein